MDVEVIHRTPLFADLHPAEQEQVAGALRRVTRSRGASIFSSGEQADVLYLLVDGFVRLIGENGLALATLGPGSLLGEAEFLRGMPHVMSAVAVGNVTLYSLSDEALYRLCQRQPEIGITISRAFGEQIVQLEDYLVERLAGIDAIGDLPHNLLRAMAARFLPYDLAPSLLLYQPGEAPHGLFLLEAGAVELRTPYDAAYGEEAAHYVYPGELFGVLPLLTNKPYSQAALSLEPGLVWLLPAADFHELSGHFPLLRRTLGRRIRSNLSPAEQTQAVVRLAQTPLFAAMEPQNLHAIAQRLVLQHVPAGEPIYRTGDAGDALYLVDGGEVELTAEAASGVIEEIDRIEAGRFFGEMSLLTGRNRITDATALRNTTLWVLYKADLDELVARYPAIGATLNQVVANQLAAQEEIVDEKRYRRFPLLTNLKHRDLREVVACLRPNRYRSGEQIYRAGDPGELLFLVERGQVRMMPAAGGDGWVVKEGEIFGERAVLTNQRHEQHAYAETDVDLLTISQADLEQLMMRLPGLAMNLSRLLSQRTMQPLPPAVEREPRTIQERGYGAVTVASQRNRPASDRQQPPPARPGLGAWFENLSPGAKLRLALLVAILLYLFFVAAPAALNRLLNGPTVAASGADMVSTANIDLAFASSADSLALLSATDGNPTPTYTPYPTDTPIPTNTPTVTATPTATPVPTNTPVPPPARVAVVEQAPAPAEEPAPAPALPPRAWDGRLDSLGVQVQEASVSSGQPYWRLVEAQWENEQEAGGKHHIYVEVLDEGGNRVVGQPVTVFWSDGGNTQETENKPAPEYAFNYPMYKAGNSYNVKVEGLASDVVQGLGLGTPDLRYHTIHTDFRLTFQRTIAP